MTCSKGIACSRFADLVARTSRSAFLISFSLRITTIRYECLLTLFKYNRLFATNQYFSLRIWSILQKEITQVGDTSLCSLDALLIFRRMQGMVNSHISDPLPFLIIELTFSHDCLNLVSVSISPVHKMSDKPVHGITFTRVSCFLSP